MKSKLLVTTLLLSLQTFAGGYQFLCEGKLATGEKIMFDRTSLVKLRGSKPQSPGRIVSMAISKEGTLFQREPFEFTSTVVERAVVEVIAEKEIANFGMPFAKPCHGGRTGGFYGSEKILEALYNDNENTDQPILLTCVERTGFSGNCLDIQEQ